MRALISATVLAAATATSAAAAQQGSTVIKKCYAAAYLDTSMRSWSPPEVIVLTPYRAKNEVMPVPADSSFAATVLRTRTDSVTWPAYWRRKASDVDVILLTFPMRVGLYGLHYELRQHRDSLTGFVATWTDLAGAKQDTSRVVATLTPCPRGA